MAGSRCVVFDSVDRHSIRFSIRYTIFIIQYTIFVFFLIRSLPLTFLGEERECERECEDGSMRERERERGWIGEREGERERMMDERD